MAVAGGTSSLHVSIAVWGATLKLLQCLCPQAMQGTPLCLTNPLSESHLPCTSDSEPREPQTTTMTHIASCMRPDAVKSSVYITQETSNRMSVRAQEHINPSMNYHLPRRSCSLRDLQSAKDLGVSSSPILKSPSTTSLPQTSTKYQLWPAARSPVGTSSEKLAALSVGRSGTSLSDTAVPLETAPFWQRAGSMSRRRKVSVPELQGTMTTVQEMPVDSRTYSTNCFCMSRLTCSKQQYQADHLFADHHMMLSVTRGPTVLLVQLGEPVRLVML